MHVTCTRFHIGMYGKLAFLSMTDIHNTYDVRTVTNMVTPPSPRVKTRTLWALRRDTSGRTFWHISWSWARNLQELINSTTGVVLGPKVQPGSHKVIGTVDETDVFALFCHPLSVHLVARLILEHHFKQIAR